MWQHMLCLRLACVFLALPARLIQRRRLMAANAAFVGQYAVTLLLEDQPFLRDAVDQKAQHTLVLVRSQYSQRLVLLIRNTMYKS